MRLIDAENLMSGIEYVAKRLARSDAQKSLIERIIYMVDHAPIVDIEPVVRCKDCKYSGDFDEFGVAICSQMPRYGRCTTRKEDFCSSGVRTEAGKKQTNKSSN